MNSERGSAAKAWEAGQAIRDGSDDAPMVRLPVIESSAPKATKRKLGKSRMKRYRAAVLISIYVLFVGHMIQWLITGMTLSPVEPSAAIQTFRDGYVNAGFIFFIAALASTLIFGRFVCGWGCHNVALQDWCTHIMTKMGIRPKPFRARMMTYAPIGVGIYMFVWPVLHREVLRPLFADEYGRLPTWLGQSEPLPAIRTEFLVADFWSAFPSWYVAIPFALIVSFGAVYFLGSKGFCTYGCPYGGFFRPIDRFAPGKIRVTDACQQCGHCTATCTSNVRVHEEVRDFGAVVDSGCMKCMDCVSVCPNDALYFGWGKPSVLLKPKSEEAKAQRAKSDASREARYDLSRREEVVIGLVLIGLFFAYRGMLNQVPMLMAVGMAIIGAFLAHKMWHCVSEPSVRLQNLQLKIKGRIQPVGVAFIALGAVMLAGGMWSGTVRWNLLRGDDLHAEMRVPLDVALQPEFVAGATQKRIAAEALACYHRAGPTNEGGFGWGLTADRLVNVAYLQAVLGDLSACESTLRKVIEVGHPRDNLIYEAARVIRTGNARMGVRTDESKLRDLFVESLKKHPHLDQIRASLAVVEMRGGRLEQGLGMWEDVISNDTSRSRAGALISAASTYLQARKTDEAGKLLTRVVKEHGDDSQSLITVAGIWAGIGEVEQADAALRAAIAVPTNRGNVLAGAAQVWAGLGKRDVAVEHARRAILASQKVGPHSGQAATLQTAGEVLYAMNETKEGTQVLREAVKAIEYSPYDLSMLGSAILRLGLSSKPQDGDLTTLGLEAMRSAVKGSADEPMLHVALGHALGACGENESALNEYRQGAELGSESPQLAQLYAQALSAAGRVEEASKWFEQAAKRAEAQRTQ